MTERCAYEKRYLYGRKAPVPATWMLLRHFSDMSFSLIFQILIIHHSAHVLEGDLSERGCNQI